MTPALLFEPDAYLLTGAKLMGRHAAGSGFLRAAVQGRGDGAVTAYVRKPPFAEVFRTTVAQIDPAAQTRCIAAGRVDELAQAGLFYRPDPGLAKPARQRLRAGPAAYSLCGVTHGLAGESTLDHLALLLFEPVMAWDAVICTSTAARSVVTAAFERQEAHQSWRTRQSAPAPRPMLPVIPLGVHCDDFAFTDADRQAARAALGLDPAEVAVLMAGRMSVNSKAHPFATLTALEKVAAETGKPIVLIVAGQASRADIAEVFHAAVAALCPSVRTVFVDGKDPAAYNSAWAAADIFVSLADSVQETFGLTPVEAMAAGLPALVSDWNGYKDTVRDGIDGFRIATWAPEPGSADVITQGYEDGANDLGQYLLRIATAIAVDMGQLADRLRQLVTDDTLRRRMGAAGRARARADFDWSVVYRGYQALWDEQTAIRTRAAQDPAMTGWLSAAPRTWPDQASPFDVFAAYSSQHAGLATWVTPTPGMTAETYRALISGTELPMWPVAAVVAARVLAALASGPMTLAELAAAADLPPDRVAEVAARLAKIDVVRLSAEPPAQP